MSVRQELLAALDKPAIQKNAAFLPSRRKHVTPSTWLVAALLILLTLAYFGS